MNQILTEQPDDGLKLVSTVAHQTTQPIVLPSPPGSAEPLHDALSDGVDESGWSGARAGERVFQVSSDNILERY